MSKVRLFLYTDKMSLYLSNLCQLSVFRIISAFSGCFLRSYLQIVVKGSDLGAGVVVDVGDPGGVVQVSVEELKVLAQTVSGRHSPTKTIIPVLDGPAGRFTVHTN